MTTEVRPMFGAHALQPEGLRAVYGGRWIVQQDGYTDIVWDRQDVAGTGTEALIEWLNEPRGKGALHKAREHASRLLKDYVMQTSERHPFVLYQDDEGVIVANTNASYGYLYVTGWLFDDLHVADSTCGLDKFNDAVAREAGLSS